MPTSSRMLLQLQRATSKRVFLPVISSIVASRGIRTHHSANVPEDTPRITLNDGSVLIQRRRSPTSILNNTPKLPQDLDNTHETPNLPPKIHQKPHKPYLDAEQIAQVKALRTEDPDKWTIGALAKKFNVAPYFIMSISRASKERKQQVNEALEEQWKKWGPKKKMWRMERLRRKDLW